MGPVGDSFPLSPRSGVLGGGVCFDGRGRGPLSPLRCVSDNTGHPLPCVELLHIHYSLYNSGSVRPFGQKFLPSIEGHLPQLCLSKQRHDRKRVAGRVCRQTIIKGMAFLGLEKERAYLVRKLSSKVARGRVPSCGQRYWKGSPVLSKASETHMGDTLANTNIVIQTIRFSLHPDHDTKSHCLYFNVQGQIRLQILV